MINIPALSGYKKLDLTFAPQSLRDLVKADPEVGNFLQSMANQPNGDQSTNQAVDIPMPSGP